MANLLSPVVDFWYVRRWAHFEGNEVANCRQTIRFEAMKEHLNENERLACGGFARLSFQRDKLYSLRCDIERDPSIGGNLDELAERINQFGSMLNKIETVLKNNGISVSTILAPFQE
jgi:hypothetical protein